MQLKLLFLDCFETEFKGKKYCVYRFLDTNSLQVISGTDLNLKFEPYKAYNCVIEWKNNKLKVTSIV